MPSCNAAASSSACTKRLQAAPAALDMSSTTLDLRGTGCGGLGLSCPCVFGMTSPRTIALSYSKHGEQQRIRGTAPAAHVHSCVASRPFLKCTSHKTRMHGHLVLLASGTHETNLQLQQRRARAVLVPDTMPQLPCHLQQQNRPSAPRRERLCH